MRYLLLAIALGAAGCLFDAPNGGGGNGGGGSAGGGGGTTSSNGDSHQMHNLATLNMYRAQAGVAPLALDDQLSTFSTAAAMDLQQTQQAHRYFQQAANSGAIWQDGFCGSAAENEAPDWPTNGDEDATIDAILKAMMDEGPGGGHHDNILNAQSTRVGVGLVVDAQGGLWLANDFSGSCR